MQWDQRIEELEDTVELVAAILLAPGEDCRDQVMELLRKSNYSGASDWEALEFLERIGVREPEPEMEEEEAATESPADES